MILSATGHEFTVPDLVGYGCSKIRAPKSVGQSSHNPSYKTEKRAITRFVGPLYCSEKHVETGMKYHIWMGEGLSEPLLLLKAELPPTLQVGSIVRRA